MQCNMDNVDLDNSLTNTSAWTKSRIRFVNYVAQRTLESGILYHTMIAYKQIYSILFERNGSLSSEQMLQGVIFGYTT